MISQQTQSETITVIVTNNVGSTRECQLLPNEGIFVGKSSNCRLQLTGDGLSDIHCRLELDQGKVSVQDWMSAAGTQVNGETITTKVQLVADDVIQIGQHRIRIATERPDPKGVTHRSDSKETPIEASIDQDRACSAIDLQSAILADATELHPDDGVLRHQSQPCDKQLSPAMDGPGLALDSPGGALDGPGGALDGPGGALDGPGGALDGPVSIDGPESMDIDADFFEFEEEETYDRETVALLQAEIEDLQAAIAQRDAEQSSHGIDQRPADPASIEGDSDTMLKRMQELIDEANRSDERVAILEEMLFAAEVTSRSEQEERGQLEAWVGDIEKRIGQREDEHRAEIDALRQRLKESNLQQERLQKQLRQAAAGGRAPESYEQTLENLQSRDLELQDKLAESERARLSLERRLEQQREEQERALRDERVSLAQEQAKVARMRFELSNKLSDIEEMPKTENQLDTETAHKIRTLREHLREIHEQEKQEAKDAPLAKRLAKLWKRVEY
jgi:hypothetical protein